MIIKIFEPAMCCITGLCGASIAPELLRISAVIEYLTAKGYVIKRYNLNNAPMEFVNNKIVNTFLNYKGVDGLPITVIDNKIMVEGRYPTNEELSKWLDIELVSLAEVNNDNCSCEGNCH